MSPLNYLSLFLLIIFQKYRLASTFTPHGHDSSRLYSYSTLTLEKSRSLSLLFSALQCISETDETTTSIIKEINANFNPGDHLDEYVNNQAIKFMIAYSNQRKAAGLKSSERFTISPRNIAGLNTILDALYPNTENWPLFYNTSVWMIGRVNSESLHWALSIVVGDKFGGTVIAPTVVEVFPQNYISKIDIAKVAPNQNISVGDEANFLHPLYYYESDPGLNEFHTNWHIDNPFWWDGMRYGVERHRRGALFLYVHHQIINRVEAEKVSNNQKEIEILQLYANFILPESYWPDIVNMDYTLYPARNPGEQMKDYDNGYLLRSLTAWNNRVTSGVYDGYLLRPDNVPEYLRYFNGTDLLGNTLEPSQFHSVNLNYYGRLHNNLHNFLSGVVRPGWKSEGVLGSPTTAMRDPAFYNLHKLIDSFYIRLIGQYEAYTKDDMAFDGIEIDVDVAAPAYSADSVPTLITYIGQDIYDIATAAKPCRGIGEEPAPTQVNILNHLPFNFTISIKSSRDTKAHGMVRIFLLPTMTFDGLTLDYYDSHLKAIELDRFRVNIEASGITVINRSSLQSSVTRDGPPPGIKELFGMDTARAKEILSGKLKRACGFPHNLLIPKGTADGLKFKIFVMISEEPELGEGEFDYPNFPYCGALHGFPYPDNREMGFPFDRTYLQLVDSDGNRIYGNTVQIPVLIKHVGLWV